MATSNKNVYHFDLGSADMIARADALLADETRELHVQVRQDQFLLHVSKAVQRNGNWSWNEGVVIIGDSSSTISLSIVQRISAPINQDSCIGRVDAEFDKLLASCAGGEFAALEMTSVADEAQEPIVGTIRVKLAEIFNEDLEDKVHHLGRCQLHRFNQHGDLSDLEESISNSSMAVRLTNDRHPNKPRYLATLGLSQQARFERLGNLPDLENAIFNAVQAVGLTGDEHPNKPDHLSNLGSAQHNRFTRLGDLSDLENAISNYAMALELAEDGHKNKPALLSNLGSAHNTRFSRVGDLSNLDNAILNHAMAVELTNDGHENKAMYLSNLGLTLRARFQRHGNLSDLETAILNIDMAVQLTDNGHPHKPAYLSSLANSQRARFQLLGNFSDLETAILNSVNAVELTDDRHPQKPDRLLNLANSRLIRFKYLSNLVDVEDAISNYSKAIRLMDDEDPSNLEYLSNLGDAQLARFQHLGNLADLENAILNHANAVELIDDGHPNKPACLLNLGRSQQARFERLGHLPDLEDAILNIEQAVELVNERHTDQSMYITFLGSIQRTRFQHLGALSDLANAIANQEKVVELTDEGHPSRPVHLLNLSQSQQLRFWRLGDLSDLEKAISNKGRAVELTSDKHPDLPARLSSLGSSQLTRFRRLGDLADLENALSNMVKAVELTSDQDPNKHGYLSNLGMAQQLRFDRLGDLSDLENATSNLERAVELVDDGDLIKPGHLTNLGISQKGRFQCLGNLFDLEKSISNHKRAIELTDDRHPHKPRYLTNLANGQQIRFTSVGDLSDLADAISNHSKALDLLDNTDPNKTGCLINVGCAQRIRFAQLRRPEDFFACVSSYQAAAELKAAYPHDALSAAREWAEISHLHGNLPSALDGYRMALELLPKVAWLGLNVPSRQDWLQREKAEDLGCRAASCAIQLGHLEEAVELLDLGRSVFWQQAASLRSNLEMLREEDPILAEEIERIGQQLDGGNFSSSFGVGQNNDRRSSEEIGKERRHLVDLWEGLLKRVRQLDQFKYFLMPVPFNRLRQAFVKGQVIIINASIFGVDGLAFSAAQPIDHIRLSDVDLEGLADLSSGILLQQPVVTTEESQRRYIGRHLKPALRSVWIDVVLPIFKKLDIPLEQCVGVARRRIWWYPTGPLTFIPIHAAGSGSGNATDVSRLVISSYVTSLDSLFESQRRHRQIATHELKLLAVSQPNTPNLCPLPQSILEVEKLVEASYAGTVNSDNCVKGDILHLNGSDATVNRVSASLDSCSLVHFACHGSQDPVRSMESAFALHDGHLKLSEIASKRLSNGQFAFLSACHAASGLKELPGEAMHLAAGVLFAGFPSVIATMWTIRDEDAPRVAYHTYRHLFRNGLQGFDPSEAATALNLAILQLREDPNVKIDQWAPFIHFGI